MDTLIDILKGHATLLAIAIILAYPVGLLVRDGRENPWLRGMVQFFSVYCCILALVAILFALVGIGYVCDYVCTMMSIR